MPWLRTVLITVGSLLAACTYVDPDPDWSDRKLTFIQDAAFSSNQRSIEGVDSPASADRIEKGDRILYGIELVKRGKTRKWIIDVKVADPKAKTWKRRDGTEHYSMLFDVRVHNEAGEEVGRDQIAVSRSQLVFGLMRACRGEEDPPPEVSEGMITAWVSVDYRAAFAMSNMLKVIRKSKVLFSILWQIIDLPSFGSMLSNLGVRVSIDSQFDKAQEIDPVKLGGHTYEAYEVPVELQLNGTPALRCKLRVTEPQSPLNLSAGILSIAAFQPSDPSARVSIRVLSARRAANTESRVQGSTAQPIAAPAGGR